jgi:large subunit ribosomal protein L24
MKRKYKSGDLVFVIAGNDKGKSGKVLGFQGVERIIIEGVNVRKKHIKKSQQNPKGQIIDIERSIHVSNVKLAKGETSGKSVKAPKAKAEKAPKAEKVAVEKVTAKAPKASVKAEKPAKSDDAEKKSAPKKRAVKKEKE